MKYHQVIVVGGGLAGLRAAIEAATAGHDVAVLTQVHPVRSHSVAAQGGINGALANMPDGRDDTPEKHAFDTVKGSDYLADQDAVEMMTALAPKLIRQMEHWGCPFSRTDEGTISQRPFGGGGFPRTCFASDKTGHALLHTMYQHIVKLGIKVYEEVVAISLVVEEEVCRGVVAMDLQSGEIIPMASDAVIFATGGAGQVYRPTTNSLIVTGAGHAMAYRAGVALKDMEFVQFHPTSLYGTNILMTEGARGEGGHLKNNLGERFMERYAPSAMELGPRDIVARSIQTEVNEGRGFEDQYVHLDLRHLGSDKILERLPGIRDIAINFAGVDPIVEPLPVQPAQHYTMGGIDCNVDGGTAVAGFYAAGEVACVNVHGANRLGGNSLLDTIVFGYLSGRSAGEYLAGKEGNNKEHSAVVAAFEQAVKDIEELRASDGPMDPSDIREEMQDVMFRDVGMFREEGPMRSAVGKIEELKDRFSSIYLRHRGKKFNLDLYRTYELGGMLEIAHVIALGALERQESRGSHYRLDFQDRDDENWLKHTVAYYTPDGPRLGSKEVAIGKWQPEARRY